MKAYLSAVQLAEITGLSHDTINRLYPDLAALELAQKIGHQMAFDPAAADWIKNRPEKRGRKRKKKEG